MSLVYMVQGQSKTLDLYAVDSISGLVQHSTSGSSLAVTSTLNVREDGQLYFVYNKEEYDIPEDYPLGRDEGTLFYVVDKKITVLCVLPLVLILLVILLSWVLVRIL